MQRPVSLASPSPEPTAPPDANLVAHRLQQRSIASTTCGWVNGDFASPVTCGEEESCFSFTSQSVHACCAGLFECFPPTTCLDSTAYVTACNITCQDDLSTLKCTAESSKYCFSQYWNGTIPMSQWGCANSPFTQTVESTFVGKGVSATGSGGSSITGTYSGSAPTGSTSSGSSLSTTGSLSTDEIIGIAIGSFIGVLIILAVLKQIIHPSPPNKSTQQQHPDNSSSGNFPLGPTNYGPPAGPLRPPVPHITNQYFYGPPTSSPVNNPSPPPEYFGYSPRALSQENMDRLQSDFSDRGPRTVVSVSNDGYSDVGDLHAFSRSPRSDYGRPHAPPSEISAAPQYVPGVL